jgi:nucleotide-binding universal stress UspA family protein
VGEFSRVIVLVDGSEGSIRASQFAARLHQALAIPLTLAHVLPMTPESVMGLSNLEKSQVEDIQRRRAQSVLGTVREALGEAGTDAEDAVLQCDPAEELLHYINADPDALVVMGRRGLSPVKSLLLGSVSDKVLRGARVTVSLVS